VGSLRLWPDSENVLWPNVVRYSRFHDGPDNSHQKAERDEQSRHGKRQHFALRAVEWLDSQLHQADAAMHLCVLKEVRESPGRDGAVLCRVQLLPPSQDFEGQNPSHGARDCGPQVDRARIAHGSERLLAQGETRNDSEPSA